MNEEGYHLRKHTISIIMANKTRGPNAVLQLMDNNIPGNISRAIPIQGCNNGITLRYRGIFGQHVYCQSAGLHSDAQKENTRIKEKYFHRNH